jgi:hypothetical protein
MRLNFLVGLKTREKDNSNPRRNESLKEGGAQENFARGSLHEPEQNIHAQ